MKLFQIEEPEGPPLDAEGPGAAVGIGLDARGGAVAFAVGGNAELLPDSDGSPLFESGDLPNLLMALRVRAERQLARPVTHAVIAGKPLDEAALQKAARIAQIELLRLLAHDGGAEASCLAAAVLAEDLAPKAE